MTATRTRPGLVAAKLAAAASGSVGSTAAALVGLATGFATVALVAQQRGASTAGVLFGAIGLFTIIATFTKLGTETTFVYFIGSQQGNSAPMSRGRVEELLRSTLGPVIAVSTAAGLVLFVGADLWARVLIDSSNEATYAATLRVLAPAIPIWAVTLPLLGVTRGLGTMAPTSVALQAGQPFAQLVFVGVALRLGLSTPWLAAGWAVPLLGTLLVAVRSVRRTTDADGPASSNVEVESLDVRAFWRQAGPRGVAGTLTMAVDRLGLILVASLGSAELAGAWVAITRLIGICLRVVHVLGQKLNTKLPGMLSAGAQERAAREGRAATRTTIVLLTAPLVCLLVFPEMALSWFDVADVAGATAALRLSTIAALAIVLFAHVDSVLLMSGRSTAAMVDAVVGLVALIVATAVLMPHFGLSGAAIGWVVSALLYRVLAWRQAVGVLGVDPVGAANLIVMATAGTSGVSGGWLLRAQFGDGLLIATVVGVAAFVITAVGARLTETLEHV